MNPDRTRPDKTPRGTEYRHHCAQHRTALIGAAPVTLEIAVRQAMRDFLRERDPNHRVFLEALIDVATEMLVDLIEPAAWVPARER